MADQSKALRLADAICDYARYGYESETQAQTRRAKAHKEAADELRRLAAVEAERDALRADAERYRWLRKCARATSEHWDGRWSLVIEGPAPGIFAPPARIDAAIDAARGGGNG